MLSTVTLLDASTWAGLIVAVGTILFFVKKIIVKVVGDDLKSLNTNVTPNGKNTQGLGDISARTEEKVDAVIVAVEEIKKENRQVRELLISHLGWHQGKDDRPSDFFGIDNVKSEII